MSTINGKFKDSYIGIAYWCVYYGFAMLFATWFCFYDSELLSVQTWNFITVQHVLLLFVAFASGALIKGKVAEATPKVAGVALAVLMIVSAALPQLRNNLVVAVAFALLFGIMCWDVLNVFMFGLNPRERLLAAVVSNVILCLIGFVPAVFGRQSTEFYILSAVFAGITALTAFLVKRPKASYKIEKVKNISKKVDKLFWLTLLLGLMGSAFSTGAVILTMNVMVADGLEVAHYAFYAGGIFAALFYFFIGRKAENYLSIGLNITFAATIIGICGEYLGNDVTKIVSAVFCGIAFITGMLSVYLCVGEFSLRFNSKKYVLAAVALIGVIGGAGVPVILNYLLMTVGSVSAVIMAGGSVITMLALLILSPSIYKKLPFIKKKDSEIQITDTQTAENVAEVAASDEASDFDKLAEYNLTTREKSVAELLLKGMTLKQIAAELNIGYSTVNTYCTSVYRKCGINSRAELFLLIK